jgi:hypothetical protein
MDRDIFSSLCTGVQFKCKRAAPSSQTPIAGALAPIRVTPSTEPATNDPAEVGSRYCTRVVDACFMGRQPLMLPRCCCHAQADNVLRKRHRIKVAGGSVQPPLRSFQQLQSQPRCPPGLQATLTGMGCLQPTPVQSQAIPILLAGREVLVVAPTGVVRWLHTNKP